MPTAEYFAARRAKKLAAQQAALPPEERIINRTDWEDDIQKKVTVLTRRARENSKRAFVITAVDPTVGICATPDEAEAFFRRGGTPFTTQVLRMFIEGSAAGRGGYIKEDVISIRTLDLVLINLFGAAKQAGNPIERDVRNATMMWVSGPLLLRGLVHRDQRHKVTALPQDITQFLQVLFSRDFMCSLPTTRDALLIALFVCLMVDCACRVSELLQPSMSLEDAIAYNKERPEKMFRWGNVEVYAFRDQGKGPVFLQAHLTFRYIKGPSDGHTVPRTKTIPLRLLPVQTVAEDSLFWLMTLGLIDGVFQGISSWSDIERLQPGRYGQLIPIVESMREVPVFRARTPFLSLQKPLVSDNQMQAQTMLKHLHRLSRFCGLEHAMLPNVLRRGAAYLLAITVSDEERRSRMGHLSTSTAYWSSYRNTTSTVDFQALRHGVDGAPVEMMSSVFLNSDTAQPPSRLSEEGTIKVLQNPEVVALLEEKSTMLDGLLRDYRSLDEAEFKDPVRHRQYKNLCAKFDHAFNDRRKKEFKLEYRAYWEQRKLGLDSAGHDNDEDPNNNTGHSDPSPIPQDHPVPTLGPSEVDLLLDEQDQQEVEPAAGSDTNPNPIDPRLLEEEEAEAADALTSLAASLDEGEATGFSDAVQEEEEAEPPVVPTPTTAPKSPAPATTATKATTGTGPSRGPLFGPRETARHSLVDDVPAWLYAQTPGTTWRELSAYFVAAFDHLHEADKFYPGQEPLPGTFDCRFCGETLIGVKYTHTHANNCEQEALARGILEKLETGGAGAVSTCPLLAQKQDGTTRRCLSKVTAGPQYFFEHALRSHREPPGSSPVIVWRCLNHGAAPLIFNSLADFRMHAVTAHNAPAGILNSEALMFFCPFCQVWIPRAEQLEEAHLSAHAGDLATTIAAKGLAGQHFSKHWTEPAFCPWCVYNPALDIMSRLRQHSRDNLFLAHVSGHLKEIEGTAVCPATAPTPEGLPLCSYTASLGPAEMAAHLREAHGLDVTAPPTETAAELEGVQEGGKAKKRKTTAGRTPLAEVDANQQGA